MLHVFPTADDPALELEHGDFETKPVIFVRHLHADGCALCEQGRCTQRLYHFAGFDDEEMAVHGLLLN